MEALQNGFRGILRLIRASRVVFAFLAKGFYLRQKFKGDIVAQRRAFTANSQRYCKEMCQVFNIEIIVKGAPLTETNFLYVGNHMGFVDIFILSSLIPALSITSNEMRETPLLGTLCEMAGCLFVERRSRVKIKHELGAVKEALEQGFNVVLYPEATSSNGEQILPFKKTLMTSAPQARRPIQPGVINFLEIDGEEYSFKWRDHVCWHGDMSFVTAMWNSLITKSMKVQVEFLQPIYAEPDADRGELAAAAYIAVKDKYRPVLPPEVLAHEAAQINSNKSMQSP